MTRSGQHQTIDSGVPRLYSASQIARACQYSKRHVLSVLALVPSGALSAAGNLAKGWAVDALPSSLRKILESLSSQKGYRSVHALIDAPVERWQPGAKLTDIDAGDIQFAERLRDCLRAYLHEVSDISVDLPGLKERTLREHTRIFGYSIKERRLHQIIEMVTERDRGLEDWNRLEIYLPKNFKLARVENKVIAFPGRFENLDSALGEIEGEKPTAEQAAFVWKSAIESLLELTGSGQPEKDVKKRLVNYLRIHAPWIGRSEEAIRRNFDRKLEVAQSDGLTAVRDRRSEGSGNFRRPDFAEDKLLLAHVSHLHEGRISVANRLLFNGWTNPRDGRVFKYSEEYRNYVNFNARVNKSRVPEFMRLAVSGPVESIKPYIFGPHAARMARPTRLRDWSDVQVNDWHTSDDETANSFVYVINPNGLYECADFRFDVCRPQILPLYDVASEMPLSLIVSPTKGYSSDTIRDLVLPSWLNDGIGMPFKGAYFERGIWSSKNVEALVKWSQVHDSFARDGIDLKIRHATTPRAKTIERIFGAEQQRTAALPGYIGRGTGESYEKVHKFLQTLKKAGQPFKDAVDPRSRLLSIEEYRDHLYNIMLEISREPNNGPRHAGRSPEEMWNDSLTGEKVRAKQVLPASLEYLLATKEVPAKVTTHGIMLTIGGRKLQFCESNKLGLLVGQTLTARFVGRDPDHIVVCDPKKDPKSRDPFVIPRRERLPAMSATREDFRRAKEAEDAFVAPQKALHKLFEPSLNITAKRADLGTRELRNAGERYEVVKNMHEEGQTTRRKLAPKAVKLGERHGIDTRGQEPQRVINALDGLSDYEARIRELEAAEDLE